MKVKIVSENAARMFSCAVGDHRDLQQPDALRLIDSEDVAAVNKASDVAEPVRRKPAGKGKK